MRRPSSLALPVLLAACAPPVAGDDAVVDTDVAAADSDAPGDVPETGWAFPWQPGDTGEAVDGDGDHWAASEDCDDADPAVNPAAADAAGDGVDQDCDGVEECFVDRDGDGAIDPVSVPARVGTCVGPPWGHLGMPPDCDDHDPAAHPGATEQVGTGVDEDCDGLEPCFADADHDLARSLVAVVVTAAPRRCILAGAAPVSAPPDCDDADRTRGGTEVVGDGIDADCDGLERCFRDEDADGARSADPVLTAEVTCPRPRWAPASAPVDCDDHDLNRSPRTAELPGDGVDEDCDGSEDCYVDLDGDGARSASATVPGVTCTEPGLARLEVLVDCADDDPLRTPGRAEILADGVDGDCDGFETCYRDDDRDGARTEGTRPVHASSCAVRGYATASAPLDCDDGDAAVHPGAVDDPLDPADTNCDGAYTCWADADLDGYRGTDPLRRDEPCAPPDDVPESAPGQDCDDLDPDRHPDAFDVPSDGVDQDCRGGDACRLGTVSCPADACADVRAQGLAPSGPVWIRSDAGVTYEGRCDQDRDDGGWTLVGVVADDGSDAWAWGAGWTQGTTTFGLLAFPDQDLRLRGFHELGVRDLMFVHRPSGVWAAYHDVGDGSAALDTLVWQTPTSDCHAVAHPLAAGTLAVGGDLCSTDMAISPAGWDRGSCDPYGAAYGPAWSAGTGGGCPLYRPGTTSSLGPDLRHPTVESDAVGFARALGLVDATGGAGAMEIWVR